MQKSICLLLILALISCKKIENKAAKPEQDFIETSDLHSKVYYISTNLNKEDCLAYNDGCDCCAGKIVFLKNGTFISDFYCIPTESFNTGTYKIENKKLVLKYSKKEALLGPEDDSDYDGKDTLRLNTINYGTEHIEIIKCKGKYLFKNEADYYSEDKKTPITIAINQYKRKGVWKLLDIKE